MGLHHIRLLVTKYFSSKRWREERILEYVGVFFRKRSTKKKLLLKLNLFSEELFLLNPIHYEEYMFCQVTLLLQLRASYKARLILKLILIM